jgi:hypothetical protein
MKSVSTSLVVAAVLAFVAACVFNDVNANVTCP